MDTLKLRRMAQQQVEDDDDLLLMAEVSEITRIPVDSLRYQRARGEGPPSFRLGRKIVYRRGELTEWIKAQAARTGRGDAA
jgi:hypothetical protein